MASFSLVGVLGFVVDAGVLYAALYVGLGLYLGRAASYMAAVTFTWGLNRRYTFEAGSGGEPVRQWARFVVSQLAGATINLGVYALLVHMSPFVAQRPVIGVAVGSLSGLLVNFSVARAYVFDQ
ncbi:MAG TPA: GtrA family protein [Steroidobacteraceae bacterium]